MKFRPTSAAVGWGCWAAGSKAEIHCMTSRSKSEKAAWQHTWQQLWGQCLALHAQHWSISLACKPARARKGGGQLASKVLTSFSTPHCTLLATKPHTAYSGMSLIACRDKGLVYAAVVSLHDLLLACCCGEALKLTENGSGGGG